MSFWETSLELIKVLGYNYFNSVKFTNHDLINDVTDFLSSFLLFWLKNWKSSVIANWYRALLTGGLSFAGLLRLNGVRSAAKGRVDRCLARAAAAVSAADPTCSPVYSAHYHSQKLLVYCLLRSWTKSKFLPAKCHFRWNVGIWPEFTNLVVKIFGST